MITKSEESKFTLSITESPSQFKNLEKMTVNQLINAINVEDSKVHVAVREALPQIEELVVRIVERMKGFLSWGWNKWQVRGFGCIGTSSNLWCSRQFGNWPYCWWRYCFEKGR